MGEAGLHVSCIKCHSHGKPLIVPCLACSAADYIDLAQSSIVSMASSPCRPSSLVGKNKGEEGLVKLIT